MSKHLSREITIVVKTTEIAPEWIYESLKYAKEIMGCIVIGVANGNAIEELQEREVSELRDDE